MGEYEADKQAELAYNEEEDGDEECWFATQLLRMVRSLLFGEGGFETSERPPYMTDSVCYCVCLEGGSRVF